MKVKHPVHLTEEQRSHIDNLIKAGSRNARTVTRARILLLTDRNRKEAFTDSQIADALSVNMSTICRVRERFVTESMESALFDKPRPGRKPKITGDIEAKITVLACSDPPEGHTRWTLRLLADRVVELGYLSDISHVAIGERLKKTRSSPGKQSRGA